MRLIDADKLLRDIEHYNLSDGKFQHWVEIQPTVEFERKKGKWVDDGTELGCCCSECGTTLDDYFDGSLHEICLNKIPNFCPNCGIKMER